VGRKDAKKLILLFAPLRLCAFALNVFAFWLALIQVVALDGLLSAGIVASSTAPDL
jgi:hypothetical protein